MRPTTATLVHTCSLHVLILVCTLCVCTLCVQVRVMLSRASHRQEGFALRGSAVRAYTPYNPVARDESWYFFLVEPNNNAVWAWTKVRWQDVGLGRLG